MKNLNEKSHNARVPAKNYRERARVVLEHMLMQMKGVADPDHWREPTEAEMEGFVKGFHAILNWALGGARQLGYAVEDFPGPLTEAEMQFVESRFLTDVTILKFDGGGVLLMSKCRT